MANGIAVIVRKRKQAGDEMFGCLAKCVEHNVRMAEQNKKAPTRERESTGNEAQTTGSVESVAK